tara:strand:- start:286 stop:660 length:375 start_codon:yes stop_codon:yes gene_type:complete
MSTLKVGTIQDTSAGSSSTPAQIEQGRAKVWVNLQGDGTAAIRDSFNVSSITDNGTGNYTVTFSNAMSNDDYCCLVTTRRHAGVTETTGSINAALSTGSAIVQSVTLSGSAADTQTMCVAIFGD